jgi:hypothetical protein
MGLFTHYNPRNHSTNHPQDAFHIIRSSSILISFRIFVSRHNIRLLLSLFMRTISETLIVAQLVKKFPSFYGIRRFFIVFTSITLSYPETEEITLYFFKIRFNIILSPTFTSSKCLLSLRFPILKVARTSQLPT